MIVGLKNLGVVVTGLALLASWGCSRGPSRVRPPEMNATAAGEAAMEEYDTNKDGKVAGEELQKAPSLRDAIKNLDTNKDGAISAEEVTELIEKWNESGVGVMGFACRVMYRGKPLPGAAVTLEPEKFLGDSIKAGKGTTDQSGMAVISVPNAELPGIAPGLYLVKITSNQVKIPPQYNEQTTLGLEVANGAKNMKEGIVFEIK